MSSKTNQKAIARETETNTATALSPGRAIEGMTTLRTNVSSTGNIPDAAGKIVTVLSSFSSTLSIPFNVDREDRKLSNLERNRPSRTQPKTTGD